MSAVSDKIDMVDQKFDTKFDRVNAKMKELPLRRKDS